MSSDTLELAKKNKEYNKEIDLPTKIKGSNKNELNEKLLKSENKKLGQEMGEVFNLAIGSFPIRLSKGKIMGIRGDWNRDTNNKGKGKENTQDELLKNNENGALGSL